DSDARSPSAPLRAGQRYVHADRVRRRGVEIHLRLGAARVQVCRPQRFGRPRHQVQADREGPVSDVMTRSVVFGVLLIALTGATGATRVVPGALQSSSTAATPAKVAAANAPSTSSTPSAPNVQILPAALSPGPMDNGIVKIPMVAINQGSERARVWFKPYL